MATIDTKLARVYLIHTKETRLQSIETFQNRLGVRWNNPDLLIEALTHSSFVNEHPSVASNERMEFLGDALLGLVLGAQLYHDLANIPEGILSQKRALLVCGNTLARVARSIGLGEYLFLGKGEEKNGGREKTCNLAGALEAILASLFLDQGWGPAQKFTLSLFGSEIKTLNTQTVLDFKSQFQHFAQSYYKTTPVYRIINTNTKNDQAQFTAEVLLDGSVIARGNGHSKKQAETDAARLALESTSYGITKRPSC